MFLQGLEARGEDPEARISLFLSVVTFSFKFKCPQIFQNY